MEELNNRLDRLIWPEDFTEDKLRKEQFILERLLRSKHNQKMIKARTLNYRHCSETFYNSVAFGLNTNLARTHPLYQERPLNITDLRMQSANYIANNVDEFYETIVTNPEIFNKIRDGKQWFGEVEILSFIHSLRIELHIYSLFNEEVHIESYGSMNASCNPIKIAYLKEAGVYRALQSSRVLSNY